MENLLTTLNSFTPLGLVGLSLFIIWQMIKNNKDVNLIKNNHLHHIGDDVGILAEKLDRLNTTMERIEDNLSNHSQDEIRLMNEVKTKLEVIEAKRK
jgi:hypothetical protein